LAKEILYYRNDHEKAIEYTGTALKLAEKLQYKTGIGDAYIGIGNVHATQVKYNEALQDFFKALKIYGEAGSKKSEASALTLIGRVYAEQAKYADARKYYLAALRQKEALGDKKSIGYAFLDVGDLLEREENYPEAITYSYKALTLFEQIGDSSGIASAFYGIGWVENKLGNYAEAKKKYAAALTTFKGLGDTYMAALMYRNMGEIFFLQGDYEAALKNDLIALKVFDEAQLKLPMAWTYTGIGNVYERQGILTASSGDEALAKSKYADALRYYGMALEIWKGSNDNFNISDAHINISNVHSHLKNVTEAKKHLDSSFRVALQIQNKGQFKRYYQSLSHLDSLEGNFKQAYGHYKKYIAYRDSLVNEESTKRQSQTKMQYEFDKKEAVAKATQEKKDREAKRIRSQQYTVIASLAILVLAVVAIAFMQWRNSRHKQKANLLLQQQKEKIESTLMELKATQSQLIQSEKMASLGELTAGIAHEIQNPLNFVINFSEINAELIDELKNELVADNKAEALLIVNDIKENEQKINLHGQRADAIVKAMLQHSRTNTGKKELSDINALADEYLRLSYHGLRAKDKTFNAVMKTNFDESIGKVNIVPQDVGRVFLNLSNNAFYAVHEKIKMADQDYEPTVFVTTKRRADKIEINVKDNGIGISKNVIEKIFQPFFTTKPTGQGTGLGLSLSYDIIKAHGGELKVDTEEGKGATFTILLPA
jgi:signal transduction histidine kinase